MNFRPKMHAMVHGFAVVDNLKWRAWDDVVADVWRAQCAQDAQGDYVSPDPRLFVMLDLNPGGVFVLDQKGAGTAGRHDAAETMSYVPAGMPVSGHGERLKRIQHLDLHFSEAAVTRRFGRTVDQARLSVPRFQFRDAKIAMLARAIADECTNPVAMHGLYGSGLVNALLALLFDIRHEQRQRKSRLSRGQLRLVTEFMEANCFRPIRLGELAELVDLSETHLSHAFKASTGLPPHRWQMRARIRKVQEKLRRETLTLSEVALAAGFSDQAHFTRVFKAVVGLTPAEWRRNAVDR
ncbi:AraC family transcriptional regulator [Mesorhizobium sp. 1M-11]|uniref:helix-turn-helix domain-containing protein n=1 Tax=Mesorhizobium sp. 1M-11 TaxID=1529006 RepID=UPI001FCD04EA|nr:AraC family transcriptional regulator [Mesorhizobium sp. 1M-11]